MKTLSLIPAHETLDFSKLPDSLKNEVSLWTKIIGEIDSAKSKSRAFTEIAKRYPGSKSLSSANIRTKYYAFQRDGWQALVNKSKLPRNNPVAPNVPGGQPALFVEYWKGLQESYQRNSRAAYRELIRRYRNGDQIPGIGNWRNVWMDSVGGRPPEKCPMNPPLPQGWGERNLMRYRPTKFELTAARIGRSAAAEFRPLVYTTRVGMAAGQVYVFDDVWHDNKVNYLGVNRQAMRPLEFSCLDLFSGCQVAFGAQPMTEDEATGKRETLRESEMRFLLCHVLCNLGYHPQGCCLHVEHGTAAIREDLADLLFNWTGGAVTVARGGIHGAAAHDGFFTGRGKGNSRFKAALESHHNLKHNELAALPGQVGRDRDHSPEELHGRDQYNNTLIKAMSQLPAHRAEQIITPFMDFPVWKQAVAELYERINWRTEHDLEGWQEAGLTTSEYRLSAGSDWVPTRNLLDLPPDRRDAVMAVIEHEPGAIRTRKLSPMEVWLTGRTNLVTLPPHYVPMILGHRNAKMLRVQDDHTITFQDRRIGPGIHRYLAQVETEHGELRMLQPGASFAIYATPFDASAVFVASEDNSFIGVARRMQTACKTDTDAIHRQIGKSMAMEKELLAPLQMRHAEKARAKNAMHTHNAAVLRGAPITPDELFRAERIAEAVPNEEDLEAVTRFDRRTPSGEDFSNEEISDLFCNN
jgi:hypothetical protein